MGRNVGRRVVMSLLVGVSAAVAVAAPPHPAVSNRAGQNAVPAVTPVADPSAAASALARRTGRQIEVAALTTETSRTVAKPDGTFRAEITAVPTRVRRGDAWVPVDTNLRPGPDGLVRPVATAAGIALSGGGSAPLVSLDDGAGRLTLTWPHGLPRPVLDGSTATYPEVLPDVDLRVGVNVSGFQELLVVKTRAAAARVVADPPVFVVGTPGATLRAEPGGGLVAVDGSGTAVLRAPAPTMWDASGSPATASGPRMGRVGVSLASGEMTLHPDASLLADPATVYPVSIDPSFTANRLNWTSVLSAPDWMNVSYWNGQNLSYPNDSNGPVMVGLDPYYFDVARAFFQMNTSSMNSKHILGAKFRIKEMWANNCTATPVDLYETGGISSSTTWNNQPGWTKRLSEVTAAYGNESFGCSDGTVEFDATAGVKDAHDNNWPDLTLGLRAPNEGATAQWKRFDTNPTLQVDYNSVPTVGTRSTTPATPCVAGSDTAPASNRPLLNSATPTLAAVAVDADKSDNNEKGVFVWQKWDGTAWVAAGSATDSIGRSAGTVSSVKTPVLGDGTYRWRVQITQTVMSPYSGTDASAWSSWCEFGVDTTPPPSPTVTSVQYPADCAPCGGVGTTGTFVLGAGAGDVTSYWYGFSDPPSTQLQPAEAGGSVTVNWTPSSGGPTTLFVQSQDAAGNRSAQTRYQFTVDAPAPPVAAWPMDEGGGAILADATGHGHTATVGGGDLGAPGRLVGSTGLRLDGGSDYASTGHLLDTSTSYSISAWVKLDDLSDSYQGILSATGNVVSAFALQYDGPDCGCFNLTLAQSDTSNPATVTAWSGPARAGVWTHLVGVFDASTGEATLYDGANASTSAETLTAPWNAEGGFQIGRTFWEGGYNHFGGTVTDVRVWQRVLFPSEVQAMLDPTSDPAAVYHFDDVNSPITFDASGHYHDLTLQGDATIPPSGAGHDGTGLLLLDGGGWAASDGPVVHTDQSFTVTAWVRLDADTLPDWNLNAVSESTDVVSSFFLGYRMGDDGSPHWGFTIPGANVPQGADGWADGWTDAFSAEPLTTADLGKWTHLVGVYDAAESTLSLYVNGVLAGTAYRNSPTWDSAGPLVVGGAQWSEVGESPYILDQWLGAIDEVRVFAGAVTDISTIH